MENLAFGFSITHGCVATKGSDLTATLYQVIYYLSLGTAGVFAPLSLVRSLLITRRPALLSSRLRLPAVLLAGKLLAGTALIALRLTLLVVISSRADLSTTRSLASAALDLAVSVILVVLSPLEHLRSVRPSPVTCSYLFFAFIYDLTRAPSLWIGSICGEHELGSTTSSSGNSAVFAVLFTIVIIVEFLFLILESWPRQQWTCWNTEEHSPEETSSIFDLGLYLWLIPLLWRGYHAPLAMKDLYALDRTLTVDAVVQQRPPVSEPESLSLDRSAETSTRQLISWVAKSLPWTVVVPVFPRLLLLGVTLAQPFFLQRLLRFLSSQETDVHSSSGLVAAAIFIYSGIAVSTALYWYYQERFQSSLRAVLINAIYTKAATAPHVSEGDAAAVTLMGTDVERIYTGLRLMHEVWASIIQIAIASWLLYQQLGLAFLAPLILVLLGFVSSFLLSRRAVIYQAAWMTRVQSRIGITSTFLSTIKDLRLSGIADSAAALVQREREEEIRVGERSRTLTATSASLSLLPQAVAPALAFAFGPRVLDETRAFTSLSLLALLTAPLMMVLQSIPILAAAIACLRRIKLFLIRDPKTDPRIIERVAETSEKTEKQNATAEGFVSIQDGAFSWTTDHTILTNINLNLPRSSITFVVGAVGAGKSTLCRALIGELPYIQGRIALKSDKIAYCEQTPFLFNASIKENIVGFSSFDLSRYNEVLRATMLIQDLKSLSAGDDTVVGTKGIALSGGQRQRISLARALYFDADILILDDIFSGLDGYTQEQVCMSVFGPNGLLRRRGTTTIVCTHSTRFLPVASHIVVISEGTIMQQGSFAQVRENNLLDVGVCAVVSDLISRQSDTDPIAQPTEDSSITKDTTNIPVPNHSQVPVVPSPMVDLDVYRHWLSTIGILLPTIYFLLVVGVGFFSNFPTIWLKMWSADSIKNAPQHSFGYWIGIYFLLGTGGILCVFPASLVLLRNVVRLSGTELHSAAVNTITRSSLRFLGTTDVGKVLNLFSQDINIMDTQLPRMTNNMFFSLSNVVGQAVVIALSSPWLALSYPLFLALLWGIQRVYLPSSKRLRLLDLEAKAPLYTNFLDTLTGLPTIRAFGWLPHYQIQNNALLDDSQRPSYLLAMTQQWLMLTMNVLVALIAVVLVTLATQLGSDAGSVGAGLVTLITLGTTLTSIIVAYTGLETSLGAISRLKSFGEDTELEGDGKQADIPHEAWPVRGQVEFRGVSASYDGKNIVLAGLDLVVKAGEKVAICGSTGSGKSSIIALLTRLIDPISSSSSSPSQPQILIDDIPLHTIDPTTLRTRIISCSQDAVFLPSVSSSIRANLDPWAQASSGECASVLHDLGLSALVAARGGGGGFDAPLRAAELSAGQRQLFGLARAVLRRRVRKRQRERGGVDGGVDGDGDGGLLLLDEITASADTETTRRVRMLLEDEFAKYTVVIVTHHKDIALGSDRVVVLDKGTIVEDGEPEELRGREGSWFRRLFGPD
ncbi:ABC transporter [Nemania sp. FL0916]|nr:ABC transporter [Nemania sp. FL0916]